MLVNLLTCHDTNIWSGEFFEVRLVNNTSNKLGNTHLLDCLFCFSADPFTSFNLFFYFLLVLVGELDGSEVVDFGISSTGELFRIIFLDFFIRVSTSNDDFSNGIHFTIQEREIFLLVSLCHLFTNNTFQIKQGFFFITSSFKIGAFALEFLKLGEFFGSQNFLGIVQKRHF
ncbi:hypothetical protein Bcep1808_2682 [Burkholderia vietnamiensis G4]|uniref:Uncharacterized protein n=1 Tax=Burkholderia vietnamiensis (strain G4 / LMG 22486) TaxID=269482 RepID=A4JHC1_BURVG|nr:hypothetical protein Bcep1808_2682 [Burkholderia vietnamiensis G4]